MTPRAPAVLLTVLLLAGCGADGPEPSPSADPSGTRVATVTMERSRFDTPELVVPLGTTVSFVNEDGYAHTVTSTDGAPVEFDSGEMGEGDVFELTFDRPGAYDYFCAIHPTMRATVIVE